jgi:LacI family transcriptional regulator
MVVRETGRLRPATRDRVHQSMKALNYVYNRGAATLRTRRSGILGLLITEISNPFFSAMALGFEEVAGKGGYMTMLTNTFDDPARQARLLHAMLEYPVDALAYVPAVTSRLTAELGALPIPVLAVTRRPVDDVPYLTVDDVLGGRLAAEHLIVDHGYRRVVYLGGPKGARPREDRLEGLRSVISQHPGAELVGEFTGRVTVDEGIRLAGELLSSGLEFDAALCHSDLIAYAVLAALRESRRTGVGVIGFDGLAQSKVFSPPVTSVAGGSDRLGREAAAVLLASIDGADIERKTELPPRLEIRNSCGCA